jgi:hypothetical protein
VDDDPELHGYWGNADEVGMPTTISHQSVLLGIPAVQLEIPADMRKEFMTNDEMFDKVCKAVADCYINSICIFTEMKDIQTVAAGVNEIQSSTSAKNTTPATILTAMLADLAVHDVQDTVSKRF